MKKSVVLLSGGLDSATCLAIAKSESDYCYALSFEYGQKAQTELVAAKQVCKHLNIPEHHILTLDSRQFLGSALIEDDISIPEQQSAEIPTTYVPARNTIFLSMALGFAEINQADTIYIGANIGDYSGYPDCRPEYIEAFQSLINVATKRTVEGNGIVLKAPLMYLKKSEIIACGHQLGLSYYDTVSCYQADKSGRACGKCESCMIRREGFIALGLEDETRYIPK